MSSSLQKSSFDFKLNLFARIPQAKSPSFSGLLQRSLYFASYFQLQKLGCSTSLIKTLGQPSRYLSQARIPYSTRLAHPSPLSHGHSWTIAPKPSSASKLHSFYEVSATPILRLNHSPLKKIRQNPPKPHRVSPTFFCFASRAQEGPCLQSSS